MGAKPVPPAMSTMGRVESSRRKKVPSGPWMRSSVPSCRCWNTSWEKRPPGTLRTCSSRKPSSWGGLAREKLRRCCSGSRMSMYCPGRNCSRSTAGRRRYRPITSWQSFSSLATRQGMALTRSAAMAALRVKAMPCRVARLEKLCHDVMGLYLRLPAVERLQFLPGQYIDILLPEQHRRSFSLANPPHDDGFLELHVRNVPGGRFSQEVFQHLHEGTLLRIQGPLGTFFLREDSTRPIVLIAGGTGFAPIQSILRHLFEQQRRRDLVFYWGARAARDLYADAKLREWAQTQPGFRYIPVLSEPLPEDRWTGRTGFVHDAVMADYADLAGH